MEKIISLIIGNFDTFWKCKFAFMHIKIENIDEQWIKVQNNGLNCQNRLKKCVRFLVLCTISDNTIYLKFCQSILYFTTKIFVFYDILLYVILSEL